MCEGNVSDVWADATQRRLKIYRRYGRSSKIIKYIKDKMKIRYFTKNSQN